MNIMGNELADKAAKKGTKLQQSAEKYVSLSYIKRKIKESVLIKWQEEYIKLNKDKFYN